MPDLFSVEGKIALVTGASSGLGGHCARVLHAAGAHVVGLSRSLGEFQAIAGDDRGAFLSGDLSEAQDWIQLGVNRFRATLDLQISSSMRRE